MPDPTEARYVFREGDHALLMDRKGRTYLVLLDATREFQSHTGTLPHSELIGREEGLWAKTSRGHLLLALKPTMADYTRLMPRIATVMYPKDVGAVLVLADIFPGATVVEAGVGSGALTLALIRGVGESGRVISYDVREDMIKRASTNVAAMTPVCSNLTIKLGDVYDGFEEEDLDRLVLDLPEPWRVVPHASDKLVPGGIFLSFLPTILQVHELTHALRGQGTFSMIDTIEILVRSWSVEGRSVRPAHQMVGHTGFITTARKCSPRPSILREDSKGESGRTENG